MLPVEILYSQGAVVLRARSSELLILPFHVKQLQALKDPKEFSRYFMAEALVNRPARKLFEAWIRKDKTTWPRLFQTVHENVGASEEGEEPAAAPAKPAPKAKAEPAAKPKAEVKAKPAAAKAKAKEKEEEPKKKAAPVKKKAAASTTASASAAKKKVVKKKASASTAKTTKAPVAKKKASKAPAKKKSR